MNLLVSILPSGFVCLIQESAYASIFVICVWSNQIYPLKPVGVKWHLILQG